MFLTFHTVYNLKFSGGELEFWGERGVGDRRNPGAPPFV